MRTNKLTLGPVFILMILPMIIKVAVSQCPADNYSPCFCNTPSAGFEVTCNAASVYKIMKSQFVISPVNVKTTIKSLSLLLRDQDRYIPANLLGNRNVTSLTISCHLQNTKSNYINLDRNALMASKNSLVKLTIRKCNLVNLDWSFLTDFKKLTTLYILSCSNFHEKFYTLPPLTALSEFAIEFMVITTDSSGVMKYPKLVNGLADVSISWDTDPFFSTAFINGFLKWLTSSSAKTLRSLSISADNFFNMTNQIGSFNSLSNLYVFNNAAPMTIGKGDLKFNTSPRNIIGHFSRISKINDGAFVGKFSNTIVHLYGNNITIFSSAVFRSMLTDMASGTGFLEMYGNPIDCDTNPCSMAWLIRDNRQLLSAVYTGQCSNGKYFYQLSAAAYSKCPKVSSRSIIIGEATQ